MKIVVASCCKRRGIWDIIKQLFAISKAQLFPALPVGENALAAPGAPLRYRRRAAVALAGAEAARMALDDIRLDAEGFYAVQGEAWREGPDGRRYEAALRGLTDLSDRLGALEMPDLSVLR